MKKCPRCSKVYTDANLNFCLEDGTALTMSVQAPQQAGWNVGATQGAAAAPKKKSKAWVWALLIIGAIVLVCGGGLVALVAYIASNVPEITTPPRTTSNANSRPSSTPSAPSTRTQLQTVDLRRFEQKNSAFGTTVFKDGQLVVNGKKDDFYYGIAAPKEFTTQDADARATVRNLTSATTTLGYGIMFHSDVRPFQKGYAFLIDSVDQRYRVVRHEPQQEIEIVDWTGSDAIRTGSNDNVLEARDGSDAVDLYINDVFVTSVKKEHGIRDGVIGVYVPDMIEIGFKKLEIRRSSRKP